MRLNMFSLEYSKATYWADFAFYALAVIALAAGLAALAPRTDRVVILALAAFGWAAWSLIEYTIHRFVLHGIQPFKAWHARHHEHPTALIGSPTVVSAALILALVFLPALGAATYWRALSLTLGVTAGYSVYTLTHHANHHWRAGTALLKQRKRWHSIHHHSAVGACYGVTSTIWDRVFRTAPRRADDGPRTSYPA